MDCRGIDLCPLKADFPFHMPQQLAYHPCIGYLGDWSGPLLCDSPTPNSVPCAAVHAAISCGTVVSVAASSARSTGVKIEFCPLCVAIAQSGQTRYNRLQNLLALLASRSLSTHQCFGIAAEPRKVAAADIATCYAKADQ
jgi:hypothetical protein